MSNLTNLIQGLVVNAISQQSGQSNNNNANNGNSNTGGLGGLAGVLGGLLNGQSNHNNQNAGSSGGLGGMLGSVLGGLNGQSNSQNQQNSPINNQATTQAKGMGSQAKLLLILVPFILSWIQKQGGFHNAIKVLTQSGMGQEVQSWVSQGDNQPVDSSKLSSAFSESEVEQLASQANTSKTEVYDTIANILPQMVNAITANGQVEGNGSTNQIQQVMSMLGGLKF